jgi:ABC-type nitrate/sulfonate/bicarbonate transport system substrate-binding protein
MTISTTTNRASFAGNGSTTAFATGFKFFANSDLTVILVVDSTGVETTKTITTHYTVADAGVDAGGTVTMVTAPAVGETLVIVRAQAYTQGLDLVENDRSRLSPSKTSLIRMLSWRSRTMTQTAAH